MLVCNILQFYNKKYSVTDNFTHILCKTVPEDLFGAYRSIL